MSEVPAGLLAALEKLPPYAGLTWRGAPGTLAGSMPLPAPLPTSRDARVASGNFSVPVLWAIVAVAGRDIAPLSADPSALEVTLLPGGVLTPASATQVVSGIPVQLVLEVRPGMPVGELPSLEEVAGLLDDARAAGHATISQPGRFG